MSSNAPAGPVSRTIVEVAVASQAETIVLGDVRDVADGVNLGRQSNQKISQWHHGKIRAYVEYKAQADGIRLVLPDEPFTHQTSPHCGPRHPPPGSAYTSGHCGF